MGLSCECDGDWGLESGDIYCDAVIDYKPMIVLKRRKRCSSCKEFINEEDLVLEFTRVKIPDTDVEVKIYGEEGEVPMASSFMCEPCGDIYLSLEELGYCNNYTDNMYVLAKEYAQEHAPGSI